MTSFSLCILAAELGKANLGGVCWGTGQTTMSNYAEPHYGSVAQVGVGVPQTVRAPALNCVTASPEKVELGSYGVPVSAFVAYQADSVSRRQGQHGSPTEVYGISPPHGIQGPKPWDRQRIADCYHVRSFSNQYSNSDRGYSSSHLHSHNHCCCPSNNRKRSASASFIRKDEQTDHWRPGPYNSTHVISPLRVSARRRRLCFALFLAILDLINSVQCARCPRYTCWF